MSVVESYVLLTRDVGQQTSIIHTKNSRVDRLVPSMLDRTNPPSIKLGEPTYMGAVSSHVRII